MGIQEQLGEHAYLSGAAPAVAAMDEYGSLRAVYAVGNTMGGAEERREKREPVRLVKSA